jgi:hypothetical protein
LIPAWVEGTPLSFSGLKNFVAEYVEPLYRPYDIGDRIVIAGNPSDDNKGVAASWYVEGKKFLAKW